MTRPIEACYDSTLQKAKLSFFRPVSFICLLTSQREKHLNVVIETEGVVVLFRKRLFFKRVPMVTGRESGA